MEFRKAIILTACGMGAMVSMAGLYGDTPDAKHAWAVHDMNRPNPVKITAEPGKAPSDAVVLFDGTTLDAWMSTKKEGGPAKWKIVEDGGMEVVPKTGAIRTKESFGDCQLHIEWASPKVVKGFGQGRGNSGVFLMGMYEIQILDSYETALLPDGFNKNPNYADGQASSVYAETPPLVNACRPSGEWQTYDIVFHQPIWDGDKMVHPGSVTVLHNGVLTQDHWEMEGLTTHCRRRALKSHDKKLPFSLQDHGNPTRFRNIWIREIPSRYDNTTHGGPAACEKDVTALRQKTAKALFAKANPVDANKKAALERMLEVIAYDKSAEYMKIVDELSSAYIAELNALSDDQIKSNKGDVLSMKKKCDVLTRNKVVPETFPLKVAMLKIIKANGFDKKK
ncbi:MAG: DUF1080 domain-containing protein [Kiritimatiellae bacterium]|jgi:hypothetical protein|nr:DUF1080 domain-containing protein [Kiritimatiellia bacterium]